MGLIAYIAVNKASQSLQDEAVAKFTAVQEAKRNHIEDYFRRLRTTIKFIGAYPYLHQCLTSFNKAYEDSDNSVDSEDWHMIVEFKEPRLKGIVTDNGFNNLYLISTEGNIVYTAARQSDLGKNMSDSEIADSGLSMAYPNMGTCGHRFPGS